MIIVIKEKTEQGKKALFFFLEANKPKKRFLGKVVKLMRMGTRISKANDDPVIVHFENPVIARIPYNAKSAMAARAYTVAIEDTLKEFGAKPSDIEVTFK